MIQLKEHFENIIEKGENADDQHFLLFPQCFEPYPSQIHSLDPYLKFCLQIH